MSKATKKIAKPKTVSTTAVVRGTAAKQAQKDANPETAMYAVLEPFKFQGAIVKPPTLIELSATEAQQYWDASVLGTEPADVPTPDETDTTTAAAQ